MNTPVPLKPLPVLTPSNSTVGTGIGGAIAALLIYGLSLKGIFLPAGIEALIAAAAGTIAGYLPATGRKSS